MKLKKSEYVLGAIFTLLAAFPLAVGGSVALGNDLQATVATTQQQDALDNKGQYRTNRRDYEAATAICIQLRSQGKGVTCPDINDAAGIAYFLRHRANPVAAASSSSTSKLTVNDLTKYQQDLLRWYRRINTCPATLQSDMPAFYELCKNFLNLHPVLLQGLTNGDANAVPKVTLDDIVKANKGVRRTQK